ncbi:uncharacterized protein LOC124891243, partial [Capsicum annuum]|uniref:uncharacterized protein LOC124891243 n=1 Tax=Capsicum annuum TaxID=4072 RepID=UPI001FB05E40
MSITTPEIMKSVKIQEKLKTVSSQLMNDICADHPNAFWSRKRHIVSLPYEDNFSEERIPTKSRPCQMNAELVEFCKREIDNLLQKGLIKPSKSPWSCTAFYVNNAAEKERGYWQIQIDKAHTYKTAFNVPFGQYEWNVMPFGLKNAPSEFQKIMNDIFNPYMDFIVVYIDDIL